MSLLEDVDREALHDWLSVRDELRADAMPDRSEYEDDPDDPGVDCGLALRLGGCGWCERCELEAGELLDAEREGC